MLSAQLPDYSAIDAHAHKAPGLKGLSVNALTDYLVAPYDNDADKVRAIYSWIRDHIKYDIHGRKAGLFSHEKISRLLIRRKTNCEGFAELFNAMCSRAGIRSEMITGYDKGAVYEPHDIFIRDFHAWNAVMLNGEWHLLDVCWSGGHFEMRKQVFARLAEKYLGIPYRIRWKFVWKTIEKYYLADPAVFVEDHLPTYCWWQLLPTPVSMHVFESDSVKEFLANPSAFPPFVCMSQDSIAYYEGHGEAETILRKANSAHEFNPNNHRVRALGYHEYAARMITDSRNESLSDENRIEMLDTASSKLKIARSEYGLYKKDCKDELNSHKKKNKAFNKRSKDHINDQIRLNNRLMGALGRHKANMERGSVQLKHMNKALEAENKQLEKVNLILVRRNRKETTYEQVHERERMINELNLNHDSLGLIKGTDSLLAHKDIPDLYLLMNKDRGELDQHWKEIQQAIQLRTLYRRAFHFRLEDDVNALSDTLYQKKMYGTFLSNTVREELYAGIANHKKKLKEDHRMMQDLLKENMSLVKKIKKVSNEDVGEDSLFLAQSRRLILENENRMDENARELERMQLERDAAIKEKKRLWQENKLLKRERTVELSRLALFNRYYGDNYSGWMSWNRKAAGNVRKLKALIKKLKTKAKERVKKEELRTKN